MKEEIKKRIGLSGAKDFLISSEALSQYLSELE